MTTPNNDSTDYQVLLYYKFTPIENPEEYTQEHLSLCKGLGLRGRILIAAQGINGTVSGTNEQCEAYIQAMRADERFADMIFKVDHVDEVAFKKMFVRHKAELVTFRVDHTIDPNAKTGTHLSPPEFKKMLEREDVVVLDGRTGYEWDLGHFRGAIRPEVDSFREFPEWIAENMQEHKDKPIITYCTGGIRCEMLTAYMMEEGFKDVYQLDGGIVTYGKDEDTKGSLWDGKCYVFDERISVEINHAGDKRVVGRCHHCGTPTEEYVDCANLECHKQHLSCPVCQERTAQSCSPECMEAPKHLVLSNA